MRAALTPSSRGFSLIEVMVGLTIGMISVLMVLRIMTVSEGYRRTTTGSGDAQNNGALALHVLQRDMRQAGYGLNSTRLLGCSLSLRAGVSLGLLTPLTINPIGVPAGDPHTDTLLVVFGNGAGSPEGNSVIQQPLQNQYAVATPTAFAAGDRVIAAIQTRPAPCALNLESIVGVTSSPPVVSVVAGIASMANGSLFNFGPAPVVMAYAIRSSELTGCDFMQNNCLDASRIGDRMIWVPIASNIVSLRAQYGRDTSEPKDAIVDTFDQPPPVSLCDWTGTLATRIAVVARSPQFEKTAVTAQAPTWAGSATAAIDLSANTSWQNYRYQVFQTTVPTRNMNWLGVPPGC